MDMFVRWGLKIELEPAWAPFEFIKGLRNLKARKLQAAALNIWSGRRGVNVIFPLRRGLEPKSKSASSASAVKPIFSVRVTLLASSKQKQQKNDKPKNHARQESTTFDSR